MQMAERGQLLALKCEMPRCYHHKGRGAFDPVTSRAPSGCPRRSPPISTAGGKLVRERPAVPHRSATSGTSYRRAQTGRSAANGESLSEIAETLNRKGVPRPTVRTGGRPPWCARPTCPRPAVEQQSGRPPMSEPVRLLLLTISLLWAPRLADLSLFEFRGWSCRTRTGGLRSEMREPNRLLLFVRAAHSPKPRNDPHRGELGFRAFAELSRFSILQSAIGTSARNAGNRCGSGVIGQRGNPAPELTKPLAHTEPR